jgi:hypothetical protein
VARTHPSTMSARSPGPCIRELRVSQRPLRGGSHRARRTREGRQARVLSLARARALAASVMSCAFHRGIAAGEPSLNGGMREA